MGRIVLSSVIKTPNPRFLRPGAGVVLRGEEWNTGVLPIKSSKRCQARYPALTDYQTRV